jgi:hypothetical protein
MSINIWTDSMQHAALLGKPVLFTNWLIQRDIIPDGWYCYDLRGTHKSPSTRTTLVDHAADYHAGTVLSPIPLKHEGTASRRVNGTFYLLGEEMTLEQFCEEHDLAYPQDNREFVLRPASLDEVGLFYSEEKLDEALGTVGHLRMDFGHGEKEFWHTWWPHNEDRFNTPEFKEVLQRFVDDLRQTGLLKNLGAMDAYKACADDRVKLQRIRKAVEQGEFDILLVFMYDQLGRNLNETPFIAEWFTKKGIHVWSVYEGEIIDGVDAERMLDYIRFWQTDEAQKL